MARGRIGRIIGFLAYTYGGARVYAYNGANPTKRPIRPENQDLEQIMAQFQYLIRAWPVVVALPQKLNASPLFRVTVLSLVFSGLVWVASERNRLAAEHIVSRGVLSGALHIWPREAMDRLPDTQGPEIEESQPLHTGHRAPSQHIEE